jgi:hypothetical protein
MKEKRGALNHFGEITSSLQVQIGAPRCRLHEAALATSNTVSRFRKLIRNEYRKGNCPLIAPRLDPQRLPGTLNHFEIRLAAAELGNRAVVWS